jgi:ATP-dependent DNA helicase RecG
MLPVTETPIEYLKGVGPPRADLLKKELGIYTFNDLAGYYPFRYVDKSKFYKVNEINSDLAYVQLKGYIDKIEMIGEKRVTRMTARFRDATGSLELIWFNGFQWLKDKFRPEQEYVIFGKPNYFSGKYNIAHPDVELPADEQAAIVFNLQAFYNSSEKLKSRSLDSKGISKLMKSLLLQLQGHIKETLSDEIIQN